MSNSVNFLNFSWLLFFVIVSLLFNLRFFNIPLFLCLTRCFTFGYFISATNVAFHAQWANTSSLNDGQIIRYKTVNTNLANEYDNNTGILQSPTPGYYICFLCQLSPMPNKFIDAGLLKNGKWIMAIYAASNSGYDWAGSNIIVWVKTFHS